MHNSTDVHDSVYSSQSLFKLPAIFVLMMLCGLSISWAYFILTTNNKDYIGSIYFYNALFSQYLNNAIMAFIITTIFFIQQKIHKITFNHLIGLLIICIVYMVIIRLISVALSPIYKMMSERFDYHVLTIYYHLISFILMSVRPIILMALIILLGLVNKQQRQPFTMPLGNHRAVFAFLFTLIFLSPYLLFLLPFSNTILLNFISDFFDVYPSFSADLPLFQRLVVSILPSIISVLIVMLYFVIIFFTVKNCFTRQFTTVPLKLIFKAVGWSYLYFILFSIVIGIIYGMLAFIFSMSMRHDYVSDVMIVLLILLNIAHFVIGFILMLVLPRRAVKKYFANEIGQAHYVSKPN